MISYRDIAHQAGVSEMTVSRVMRDGAKVRPETRKKVLAAAENLGYQRNPLVDTLMKQVRSKRVLADVHRIAWIYPEPGNASKTVYALYLEGAKERAKELGFVIDDFTLNDDMSPKRLRDILLTRGIRGILVSPTQSLHLDLEFNFDGFSAVTFGYTLRSPNLNRISSHHTKNQFMLLNRLRDMGFQDILYASPLWLEERINFGWLAPTMAFAKQHERDMRVRCIFLDELEELLANTPRSKLPEVIICDRLKVAELTKPYGLRVPTDFSFVTPTVELTTGEGIEVAGIDQCSWQIGARAVEFLAELLAMNRFGAPVNPSAMLVEGIWCEGETLITR